MPRTRETGKPTPDDEVRLAVRMPRSERGRIKAVAARIGEDMEDVARRWLIERLTQEERKLQR